MSFQQIAAPQPPPGPVDLDAVSRTVAQFSPGSWTATVVPVLVAELRAAREVLKDFVDQGPWGHKFEPWSEQMLEEFIQPQLANPDPFDGPPHPTCSACSKDNDPQTTDRAHQKFELWLRAKQAVEP